MFLGKFYILTYKTHCIQSIWSRFVPCKVPNRFREISNFWKLVNFVLNFRGKGVEVAKIVNILVNFCIYKVNGQSDLMKKWRNEEDNNSNRKRDTLIESISLISRDFKEVWALKAKCSHALDWYRRRKYLALEYE